MPMTFAKLFSSITESTVWREDDHTRILWITMLAMANKNGYVFGSVPGLADRARIPLQSCVDALGKFQSPDEWSRTKEFEGRRIQEVDGGWQLLNYQKHRAIRDEEERREYMRNFMREKRAAVSNVNSVSRGEPGLSHTEADAEADTEKNKSLSSPSVTSSSFELSGEPKTTNRQKKKTSRADDPRHAPFRQELETFWSWKNQGVQMFAWGVADNKQLYELLKRWPKLTLPDFKVWLRNYADSSDITPSKTPKQFLPFIHDYASGPRDKYHHVKAEENA